MSASRLPPGPPLPRAVQATLWAYRFPGFTGWAHRRYGASFTANVGGLPTAVVTTDRDAVRRVFTGDPSGKRHANDLLREFLGDRSVMLLEPGEHLTRRRLLTPSFHGDRVRGYARLMEQLVSAELDEWRSGQEVTVLPIAQRLTLEVILQAVLGVSDAGLRDRLRALFDAIVTSPGSEVALYYPKLGRRSRWNAFAMRYWRHRDALDALLDEHITRTRNDPDLGARDDILAMLAQAHDEDGNGLTDTDLRHDLNTLISAGHETTAAAIASGAELLTHHPAIRQRARRAVEDGDAAYMDALVKEVLRYRTPITVAAARQMVEPFEVGSYVVPPEVTVIVNPEGVHRDPSVHPDPDTFKPERFLEPTPDYSLLAFGGGAHRCIGAALAQLEMKVVLSAIVSRFDLLPASDTPAARVRRGITLVPARGGRVRVGALHARAATGPVEPAPVA